MNRNTARGNPNQSSEGGSTAPRLTMPPPLPSDCENPRDRRSFTGAPPVRSDAITSSSGPSSASANTYPDLRRRSRTSASSWTARSTSWLSSLAVHLAVLLILYLLLAPADYGGTGFATFTLTLKEESQEEAIAELPATLVSASLTDEIDHSVSVASASLPGDLLDNAYGTAPEKSAQEKSAPGQAGGASGSFFGLEATGHEFVYVLDVSGSMSGRRYRRATSELVSCVEKLGPHQSFYVLLFNTGTTRMFNSSQSALRPVAANAENKRRLAKWLMASNPGGGTDPRDALRIATQMAPSAIFMLSDGQFNGHQNQTRQKLWGGNSDAFSIVAAATQKTPIHSIAFENRISRSNMKRLADMTDGKFRFVAPEDSVDPAEAFQSAQLALSRGDDEKTKGLLHTAAINLQGEEGEAARKLSSEVIKTYRTLAERGFERGDLGPAKHALAESVLLGQGAADTNDFQKWLSGRLLDACREELVSEQADETLASLFEFVQQTSESPAAGELFDSLAELHFKRAKIHEKQDSLTGAVLEYEKILHHFPETSPFASSQSEHQRICNELLQKCKDLRRTSGNEAAVTYTRKIQAQLSSSNLSSELAAENKSIAREMVAAARDARLVRNAIQARAIEAKIAEIFDRDPAPNIAKRELGLDERRAEAMMRTAMKLERSSRMVAAEKYRLIVNNYPDTLNARKAEQRLRFFGM